MRVLGGPLACLAVDVDVAVLARVPFRFPRWGQRRALRWRRLRVVKHLGEGLCASEVRKGREREEEGARTGATGSGLEGGQPLPGEIAGPSWKTGAGVKAVLACRQEDAREGAGRRLLQLTALARVVHAVGGGVAEGVAACLVSGGRWAEG